MSRRWPYLALAVALLAGVSAYSLTRPGNDPAPAPASAPDPEPEPAADLAPAKDCSSCTARKKDMQRLQGVLNPPDDTNPAGE